MLCMLPRSVSSKLKSQTLYTFLHCYLQVYMSTVCTWTEQVGIVVTLSWLNPQPRSCTPWSRSCTCLPPTKRNPKHRTCTNALCTRNQGVRIWPTFSHSDWRQTRTPITGPCAVLACSVTRSKGLNTIRIRLGH